MPRSAVRAGIDSAIRDVVSNAIDRSQRAVDAYIPNKGGYLTAVQVRQLAVIRRLLGKARKLARTI